MTTRLQKQQTPTNKYPNHQTINIACKDISEHWGVIWENFRKLLSAYNKTYLTSIKWNYTDLQFQMKYHSSHISSFNIYLFPDYYDKQLRIRYNNPTIPNLHSQEKVEKYSINQYFKSIPIKSTIKNENKRKNNIPNYYIYNYGVKTIDGKQYEDIIYTVHIPCLVHIPKEEYPIISITFSMLIPVNISISSNTFLWDIFLDNINLLFFHFQLKHFEENGKNTESYKMLCDQLTMLINNFDDYMISVTSEQIKKDVLLPEQFPSEEFISTIITSHITSYYTLIMFDEYENSQYVYDICYLLDSPSIYNQPLSSPINPKILLQPNPFFRTMCLSTFEKDRYYSLPFPYTVINPTRETLFRSRTQSMIVYFMQRANYLLSKVSSTLQIYQFIPTVIVPDALDTVPFVQIEFSFSHIVKQMNDNSYWKLLRIMLFKYCDILAMKAHLLLNNFNVKEYLNGQMTFQTINDWQKVTKCNDEELKLILSIMKFSESFVIGIVIEMLEKYRNNIII